MLTVIPGSFGAFPIFSSAWLCQQSLWNRNLSVVNGVLKWKYKFFANFRWASCCHFQGNLSFVLRPSPVVRVAAVISEFQLLLQWALIKRPPRRLYNFWKKVVLALLHYVSRAHEIEICPSSTKSWNENKNCSGIFDEHLAAKACHLLGNVRGLTSLIV